MCVLFFFKQKTAYEMRISDWSSDVCSSDLGEGVVGAAADADRGAVARRGVAVDEGEVRNGHFLTRNRVFIAVRVDFHDRVADRAAEIGRASCRERVCQYV